MLACFFCVGSVQKSLCLEQWRNYLPSCRVLYVWRSTTDPECCPVYTSSYVFRKRGHKDGEFYDPYSIAVSDDHSVYVSDTCNDRVRVFK